MTLKALDKQYESFYVGDVVVMNGNAAPYGVKIVKKVFIEETDQYHFITLAGDVIGGRWVIAKSGSRPILSILTTKELRSYTSKWTPGETFNVGDILKDQDGTLYLYASEDNVWNLTEGTRTTQANWEASGTSYGGRVFERKLTASGDPFTKFVKMEDIWTSRR